MVDTACHTPVNHSILVALRLKYGPTSQPVVSACSLGTLLLTLFLYFLYGSRNTLYPVWSKQQL
jgi:hypothetical protein